MTLKSLSAEAKEVGLKIQASDKISKCLKEQLRMTYRLKHSNDPNANVPHNKIIRQQFVLRYLDVLESGKVIVNVDESAITKLDNQRKCWQYKDEPRNFARSKTLKRISLQWLLVPMVTPGTPCIPRRTRRNNSDYSCIFSLQNLKNRMQDREITWYS